MKSRGLNTTVIYHDKDIYPSKDIHHDKDNHNVELITDNIGLVVGALGVILALLTLIVALAHLRHDGWTLRFFARRTQQSGDPSDTEMNLQAPGPRTGMRSSYYGLGDRY